MKMKFKTKRGVDMMVSGATFSPEGELISVSDYSGNVFPAKAVDVQLVGKAKPSFKIDFLGLITLALVIGKLCGVIAWAWVWCFLPLIVGFSLAFLIWLIIAVYTHNLSKNMTKLVGGKK